MTEAFVFSGLVLTIALLGAVLAVAWKQRSATRRDERYAARGCLAIGCGLPVAFSAFIACEMEPSIALSTHLRTLEHTGAPLIDAIDPYVAAHGRPPHDLEALVPEFIAAIPTWGYRGDTDFDYIVTETRGPTPSWTVWALRRVKLRQHVLIYSSEAREWTSASNG